MSALSDLFTDIAAAIREKADTGETMKPAQFPDQIRAIETGSGEGVDPYYQQLAEAVIMRNAKYLSGDETTMSMKGFVLSDGNTLGTLAPYSFAGFEKVECMAFTDVVMIGTNSFAGNAKLKILDITVTEPFPMIGLYDGALNGCDALEALIVREGAAGLTSASVNSAHGSNSTFYVYVPAAYYDSVVANLGANTLSADRYRRLEDYPAVDQWSKTVTA